MHRFLLAAALALATGACVTDEDLATDDLALAADVAWDYQAPALTAIQTVDAEPCGTMQVVADPRAFDGQVINTQVDNGLSCTNCHAVTGPIPKNDQIRDRVIPGGARRP